MSDAVPMTAHSAIAVLRRDLALGQALRVLLLAGLLIGMLAGNGLFRTMLLAVVGTAWITMTIRSRRGSVLAAGAPPLIASGHYDEAEQQISAALRSFSLFRQSKLLSLHHLALLRHAQRRWPEVIVLGQALLRQKLTSMPPVARSARLILADALLETGDLHGAYAMLAQMYQENVPLGEAVKLLSTQLDYEAQIGAWDQMLHGINAKLRLAELMSAHDAGKAHALLALAARKGQRKALEEFLCRRAGLLTDVQELVVRRPMLRELWA